MGLYAAVDNELCPRPAALELLDRGIGLAYPRVLPGQRALSFHLVDHPDALVRGTFGIPEPPSGTQAIALDDIGLFLVPGIAFDRRGHRLGWGRGHYDATLAQSTATRIGFAHALQLVELVPSTSRDLAMDIVITDTGIIHTGARAEWPGRQHIK